MRWECRKRMFSPPVSDPDMHHGTCVTHMPWCMLGLVNGGGENIPCAWETRIFTYLVKGPLQACVKYHDIVHLAFWYLSVAIIVRSKNLQSLEYVYDFKNVLLYILVALGSTCNGFNLVAWKHNLIWHYILYLYVFISGYYSDHRMNWISILYCTNIYLFTGGFSSIETWTKVPDCPSVPITNATEKLYCCLGTSWLIGAWFIPLFCVVSVSVNSPKFWQWWA